MGKSGGRKAGGAIRGISNNGQASHFGKMQLVIGHGFSSYADGFSPYATGFSLC